MNGEILLYMCVYIIILPLDLLNIYFNVKATVLLNANVAFLAIQSVDSSGSMGHSSNAQIASYLSIVDSVGTMLLGLLLVREHNTSSSVCRLL
jgi:hypothetical protein